MKNRRRRDWILLAAAACLALAGGESWAQARKARKGAPAPAGEARSPGPVAAEEGGPEADFEQFEGEDGRSSAKPVRDPLRGYNRVMFQINDRLYFWVAKPAAIVYGIIIPTPGRVAIKRGYRNMAFPIRFVSSGLQGKFNGAGRELGRFVVNSTIGLGGLFDPASEWFHIRPSDEDFGQMLGYWGVGDGFPLVLPVLGPSNLRDGVGLIPNSFANPAYYLADWKVAMGVSAGGQFNDLSLRIGDYEKIKKDALDPYTFMRDAYKQYRDQRIKE